jgi:hypothetical protein
MHDAPLTAAEIHAHASAFLASLAENRLNRPAE